MTGIMRAVITRWNALNLNGVAGSITRGQVKERTQPPYCEVTELSDAHKTQTRASRYGAKQIQFKVYHSNSDTLDTICGTVRDSFLHGNNAATSPLVATASGGKFTNIQCVQNPVTIQETDQLFSGTMVFSFDYAEDGGLTPP